MKQRTVRLKGEKAGEIRMKQGELDSLILVLEEDGLPRNLTTDTVPKIYLIDSQSWQGQDYNPPFSRFNTPSGRKWLKLTAYALTITGASAGEVTWQPLAAHVDTAGDYYFEVTLLDSGGHLLKWPSRPEDARLNLEPSVSAP